jgi:hypothetical protein
MYKHIAIAAAALFVGLYAGITLGAEIIRPDASLGGSAAAESDAPTRADVVTGAGIRGASGGAADAVRLRLQPDSTTEPHVESGHANVGAEPASAELSSKSHAHGRWQALLPGVMK